LAAFEMMRGYNYRYRVSIGTACLEAGLHKILPFSQLALFLGGIFLISGSLTAQQTRIANVNSAISGIEKLHQQDIAATVLSDVGQLVALWDDDGVLIGQGEKPLLGKAAIKTWLTENFAKAPSMKVLKYEPEVKNLEVAGDLAYEWGYFTATQQALPGDKPVSFRARFLRVLRLQSNGSWKFVRAMWTADGQ
jgi:ketosteroid isomerase-like protein